MPPVAYLLPCTTATSTNMTTPLGDMLAKDDRNALLYIVVTLLFYSMGIIVGIITYLKRERREMLEDKTFDVYFQMKSDPYTTFKSERVQMMAARLAELERERLEKIVIVPEPSGSGEKKESHNDTNPASQSESSDETDSVDSKKSSSLSSTPHTSSNSIPSTVRINLPEAQNVSKICVAQETKSNDKEHIEGENPEQYVLKTNDLCSTHKTIPTICNLVDQSVFTELDTSSIPQTGNSDELLKPVTNCEQNLSKSADETTLNLLKIDSPPKPHLSRSTPENMNLQRNVQIKSYPLSDPQASGVSKVFEQERRGGLLMSPKALHLFDRNKRKLRERQLSMDVPDSETSLEFPNRNLVMNRQLSMDVPDRQAQRRQMLMGVQESPLAKGKPLSVDVSDRQVRNGSNLSVDQSARRRALRDKQHTVDLSDTPKRNRLSVGEQGRRGALRERQLSVDVPDRVTDRRRQLSVDIPGRRGALRERQLSFDVSEREKLPNKECDMELDSLLVEDEPLMDSEDDPNTCLASNV